MSYLDSTDHEIVCANNVEQCKKVAAAATGTAEAAQRIKTQTTTSEHKFLFFRWTTSKTTIAINRDITSFKHSAKTRPASPIS